MATFEETTAECIECKIEMRYFGMPKCYLKYRNLILPLCVDCKEKFDNILTNKTNHE